MTLYTNWVIPFNRHRPTQLVLVLTSTNWIFVFEGGPTHHQWVLSLSTDPPWLNNKSVKLIALDGVKDLVALEPSSC